jgi:tetratricopeptide (TPR) repeat protein
MIDALGMFDEAIDKGTEALRILEKVYGKESEQAASALNVLASCYYYKDDLAKAEALFRARLRLLNETHPDYVTTLSNIANVFERLDRLREAEDLHRRALRQLEERSKSPTTFVGIELEIASCLCGLAAVLMKQHKNVEAEAALTRALELYSKNLPDHHVLIGGAFDSHQLC